VDFSAQLDNLKKRVDDTVATVKAAAQEDRKKLQQRIEKAEVDANLALKDTEQKAGETAARARGKWDQIRADASAKMDDAKAKIDKRNQQMDAAAAAADAQMSEDDAKSAINFALWAVDNARVAVLDSLDAAAYSSEMGRVASS